MIGRQQIRKYGRMIRTIHHHEGAKFRLKDIVNQPQKKSVKLKVEHSEKEEEERIFSYRYLRDYCHCNECYNKDTHQRAVDTRKTKGEKITRVGVHESEELIFETEKEHKIRIPHRFILEHYTQYQELTKQLEPAQQRITWRGTFFKGQKEEQTAAVSVPEVDYNQLFQETIKKKNTIEIEEGITVNKSTLYELLQYIAIYGYAIVRNTPAEGKKETERVVKAVSTIRNTLFGDFWEFENKTQEGKMDTAYTSQGIESHTDNTYFNEPSRMLVLHCVKYNAKGAQTTLVDGFKVLERLKPATLDFLSSVPLAFHYTQKGMNPHRMRHKQRVIQYYDRSIGIKPQTTGSYYAEGNKLNIKDVRQFAFNNLDRDAQTHLTATLREQFYEAYDELMEIIDSPTTPVRLELRPGAVLFIDNWRLMHGRTAFEGERKMIGAYLHSDDFESKLQLLAEESNPWVLVPDSSLLKRGSFDPEETL